MKSVQKQLSHEHMFLQIRGRTGVLIISSGQRQH